jgi:hypothetical protein
MDPALIALDPIEFLEEALYLLTLGDLDADDAFDPL